ncbi:hypothetical protein F5148DRAFT_1290211 [Russula earlei]|uniref:Uncharacterized protein n=1 Tax=Russula earlei TaxID=71964 RepID=A0ACC0TW16_9AGAM|nr:hypothetical protein F5148DRAFT_1290211 [Russula earlei]
MQLQLLDLPEELLLVILESAVAVPPADPRASLLLLPDSGPLLACRTLHRIGLPVLYRTLVLKSSSNAGHLQRTLLERPTFVRHVRHLYSRVPTLRLLLVLRAICRALGSLEVLDFAICPPWVSGRLDGSAEEEPLTGVSVRQLAVREPGVTAFLPFYASSVANVLAEAIDRWPNLEVAEIEPRILLSSTPGGQPSPVARALSRSPSLRLLRTVLPPAWNPALLLASENSSLKRIALTKPRPLMTSESDGTQAAGGETVSSSEGDLSAAFLIAQKEGHPWLGEARMHCRLMELLVAP